MKIINDEVVDGTITFESKEISNAKNYLESTDWYYARKAETNEEIPADIVTKRLEARELIRNNNA